MILGRKRPYHQENHDVQQMIKEEAPEDQKPSVDQQDPEPLNIKEEEEEVWKSPKKIKFPADVQQMIKEEAPEDQRPGVDQQDPEPLNIKEEEEVWSSQEEKNTLKTVLVQHRGAAETCVSQHCGVLCDRDITTVRGTDPSTAHKNNYQNMDEERFIMEVEKQKVLYDPAHPFYKDNSRKERAWKEVSAVFGVEVDICKVKWKALRDGFVKNRKRSLLPSGSAGGTQRDWKYADIMSFLLPFVHPRCLRNNLRTSGAQESGGSTTSLSERSSTPGPASETASTSDVRDLLPRPQSPKEHHQTPSAPGKKSAGKTQKFPTTDISERLLGLLEEPAPAPLIPRDPTEEAYYFAVSIVPALGRLDRKRMLEAKLAILKLLGDLEEQQSQDDHIAPHHPVHQPTDTQRTPNSFYAEG